eukprot:Hpha_TRINITY_DN15647_c4_g11::TRINITY_DN15647_c4_g11_i4::g.101210::m.101210
MSQSTSTWPEFTAPTMQDASKREDSLYFILNSALRDKVRSGIRKWKKYLWLLLNALKRLPPSPVVAVFRGCAKTPSQLGLKLERGFEFTWSGLSSTATTIEVMKAFLGTA